MSPAFVCRISVLVPLHSFLGSRVASFSICVLVNAFTSSETIAAALAVVSIITSLESRGAAIVPFPCCRLGAACMLHAFRACGWCHFGGDAIICRAVVWLGLLGWLVELFVIVYLGRLLQNNIVQDLGSKRTLGWV